MHTGVIYIPWSMVQPVSKTNGPYVTASLLLAQFSSSSSQDMPVSFKPRLMESVQFFLGIPGIRSAVFASKCMSCFGSLPSSIHKTCLKVK